MIYQAKADVLKNDRDVPMRTAIDRFWAEFCEAKGLSLPCPQADQFGDTPEMADELLKLVLSKQKQATCELKHWFDSRGEALPKTGDYWIILDGEQNPRTVIQTTQVDLYKVCDVDDKFAWEEGEGDRSLAYWKHEHDLYFTRQAARDGFTYSDSMICICERFKQVWPD